MLSIARTCRTSTRTRAAAEAQLSQSLAGGGAQLASLNVSRAAY